MSLEFELRSLHMYNYVVRTCVASLCFVASITLAVVTTKPVVTRSVHTARVDLTLVLICSKSKHKIFNGWGWVGGVVQGFLCHLFCRSHSWTSFHRRHLINIDYHLLHQRSVRDNRPEADTKWNSSRRESRSYDCPGMFHKRSRRTEYELRPTCHIHLSVVQTNTGSFRCCKQ